MSLINKNTIKLIKIKKPINEIEFLIDAGISFLKMPSIVMTIKCQPSKPGNGNKLKTAKLTEIRPQIKM